MKRKRFTKEFKLEALRLLEQGDKPAAVLARELGEYYLQFHQTERAVKTASSEQVRQPIYSSSVNLWRNYEDHLGELIKILEPVLQTLPTGAQPAKLKKDKK